MKEKYNGGKKELLGGFFISDGINESTSQIDNFASDVDLRMH